MSVCDTLSDLTMFRLRDVVISRADPVALCLYVAQPVIAMIAQVMRERVSARDWRANGIEDVPGK